MNDFIIPIILGATTVLFVLGFITTEFVRLARSGESFLTERDAA